MRKIWLAAGLLMISGVMAQSPDRPPKPEEWGYRPADRSAVAVNPPSLSWVSDGNRYRFDLQWAQREDFTDAATASNLAWSVYTHNRPLAAGSWYWRYRVLPPEGPPSAWSRTRSFRIPADAVEFPLPTMEELAARIPKGHPRLFVTAETLPRLREFAQGAGRSAMAALRKRADELRVAEPTPEPREMGSSSNPATVQFWWSNRVQTLKACQEAEILAFTWLLTGEDQYRPAARRWVLHLASWNPDGPTQWRLNDEAAMPILHRMARAYDWAHAALSDEERARVRAVLLRRALDAWKGGQTGEGAGHLNRPYNSHGNRSWHKLAENAIATFGETPESARFLDFAVNKFYAAYPVWSDDDGGWHEGLSYWAGYMTKIAWWMDVASTALGIDGSRKPYFAHFADYGLYTAPPGSPDGGFGDLAFSPVSRGWSFVHYFVAASRNPYWAWWAREWQISPDPGEPVLAFLWASRPAVDPRPPAGLPPSKVFHGIGVAVLNTTLVAAADNVQVRFKSSPMGRQSHGHEPHNAFTLNAYGDALLVNNVYRDLYGSPFHKGWCWETRSQNALLVDGTGQKIHSADPLGRIIAEKLGPAVDYVAGEAAEAYPGKLKRFVRHVLFVKPELVIVADEVEAVQPAVFQWMLHGAVPFKLDEAGQGLSLERERAGVAVSYFAPEALALRQWTGYEPDMDRAYLRSINRPEIPAQWHVEAATRSPRTGIFVVTVMRPYRMGSAPAGKVEARWEGERLEIRAGGRTIRLRDGKDFFTLR